MTDNPGWTTDDDALAALSPEARHDYETRRAGQDLALQAAHALEHGDYDQAIQQFHAAIQRVADHLGPDHPEIAGFRCNLGLAYSQLGRHEDARAQLTQALAIFERMQGRDGGGTLITVTNLGLAAYQSGDLTSALKWYQRAADAYDRTYGPDAFLTAQANANVAAVLLALGDHDTPGPLLQTALATFETLGFTDTAAAHAARQTLAHWHTLQSPTG